MKKYILKLMGGISVMCLSVMAFTPTNWPSLLLFGEPEFPKDENER